MACKAISPSSITSCRRTSPYSYFCPRTTTTTTKASRDTLRDLLPRPGMRLHRFDLHVLLPDSTILKQLHAKEGRKYDTSQKDDLRRCNIRGRDVSHGNRGLLLITIQTTKVRKVRRSQLCQQSFHSIFKVTTDGWKAFICNSKADTSYLAAPDYGKGKGNRSCRN